MCKAPLMPGWVVLETRASRWMSNHGWFVGVFALALALAAKKARLSLISGGAANYRCSSSVAMVSPQGFCRSGFPIANRDLVASRYRFAWSCDGGSICKYQWDAKVFKVLGKRAAKNRLLATRGRGSCTYKSTSPLGGQLYRKKCATRITAWQVKTHRHAAASPWR